MSGSTPVYAFDASRYPRTYEPALGNRLIWISFGCLLMAAGTWGWYSSVAGDELGPKGPAVTISLSLTLVLLGGYLILIHGLFQNHLGTRFRRNAESPFKADYAPRGNRGAAVCV